MRYVMLLRYNSIYAEIKTVFKEIVVNEKFMKKGDTVNKKTTTRRYKQHVTPQIKIKIILLNKSKYCNAIFIFSLVTKN